MKRIGILIGLFIITQIGCKEEYNPLIDSHVNALVIEGRITNLKESYKVKISSAVDYDSLNNNQGILGANVTVIDDMGNSYTLHENNYARAYFSDTTEFVAKEGRSYSLIIQMPNGEIYKSAPQLMTPAVIIDSIYGNVTNKEYLYLNDLGELTTKMAFGSESFVDLRYLSDTVVQFRSDNTIMKCYSYWYWYTPEMKGARVPFPPPNPCVAIACPYPIYNWKKFRIDNGTNLTVKANSLISKNVRNNSICFFPFANSFYPILIKKDSCGESRDHSIVCITIKGPSATEGTLLSTRIYSLNKTSADFYNQVKNQLSSQGRLFDPIAVQIKGNVKCISNPNKNVLGLFEVSPCTTRSYWLIFNYVSGYTIYQPIDDITDLPDSGGGKQEPGFWQKIFH